MAYCILRTEKLTTLGNVASSLEHELRLRETKNADEKESKSNIYRVGKNIGLSQGINFQGSNANKKKSAISLYKKLLPKKMKDDNVTCIQLFFSASAEAQNQKDFYWPVYFMNCRKWAEKKFGAENVFFESQHYDESTPHMNLFVVPGYDFEYKDGHKERRLSAKKWLGGRQKMSELQDDFFDKVGKLNGLERGEKGSKAEHLQIQKWYKKFNQFCKRLHIEPQQKNETVDEYFERVARQWNIQQNTYEKFTLPKKEHEFYEKYHDNISALQTYLEELKKRSDLHENGQNLGVNKPVSKKR